MSFFDFFKKEEVKPTATRSVRWLDSREWQEVISSGGYMTLDKCPEIITGCRRIADLISSMTLYLMANTAKGDKRVINELSRKVDITPYKDMTRRTWMSAIVMNMLLYGRGNSFVLPHTSNGLLADLEPIEADRVQLFKVGNYYEIEIDGVKHKPEDVLHFVYGTDKEYLWKGTGITTTIKDVANNLKQATATETAFLQSKWKPSVVVKVDALIDEFSSPEGRQKLVDDYLSTNRMGEPWIIPAEQFSIDQIRPLSLADLAIADVITLDRKSVASILGVPAFVLGVGDYNKEEWNAFVNNTVRPIAQEIEQELTQKLLLSQKMYWKFNIASLYSYDLQATASVYSDLFVRGIVTGNEVRNKVGLEPIDGLDSLVILENYIPLDRIGDQLKLKEDN